MDELTGWYVTNEPYLNITSQNISSLVLFGKSLSIISANFQDCGYDQSRLIFLGRWSLPSARRNFFPVLTLRGVNFAPTIRIGNTRIRLHGIDAPEAKQNCSVGGKVWRCGQEATNALVGIAGEQQVSCSQRDVDRYGRIVAVCRAGAVDLNAWMVGEGWAVAYRRFSMDYVRDEGEAKQERKGLWRGEFAMPWDWRRRKR